MRSKCRNGSVHKGDFEAWRFVFASHLLTNYLEIDNLMYPMTYHSFLCRPKQEQMAMAKSRPNVEMQIAVF